MKTALVITALAGAVALAPAAQAGPKHRPYDSGFVDEAEVVRVDPIVRTVQVSTPRRECWEEEVRRPVARYDGPRTAGPMILGGIVGGVIGSEIGRGHRGRDGAALAGTLIGASIAHDIATRAARAEPAYEEVDYVQRCRVISDYRTEERIDGYDVTYRYRGEMFTTRLPYDPGKHLRVRVQVLPLRD